MKLRALFPLALLTACSTSSSHPTDRVAIVDDAGSGGGSGSGTAPPLDTTTMSGADCYNLLTPVEDTFYNQLQNDLLPPTPSCHTEPAPPAGTSDIRADKRDLAAGSGTGSDTGSGSGGSGSGSADDPDYATDPETVAIGDNADETPPGETISCDYSDDQLSRDAAARAALGDFDNAFRAWLAAQGTIVIDGASYTGSQLMTCEGHIDADPVQPPEDGLCTADTAAGLAPEDNPACAPADKLNCMAIVWPNVNSYAHYPKNAWAKTANDCTSDWRGEFRETWAYNPSDKNGGWAGATGVNAYGGYGARHNPLVLFGVTSCSEHTDNISTGARLEFKPRTWFVPKKVYDFDKKSWVSNDKHVGNFYGPDGKKYGPTCTADGLPYDRLYVKARYAPKLKEVFSGRTEMDDDGRITGGISTNDHRAEVQGSLTCRAPNTAVTNPDTFSVVQGQVEVPFHAWIEPNCTTETSAGIDAHGSYQSDGKGGASVGLSAGTKEGCKKNSGTAISLSVSCDLIGGADMVRAYTSEVDMKQYAASCVSNNQCAPLDFMQGKGDPLPWLNVAWEVTNLYAWARSAGTGCDFLNKRACVAWAYFKSGGTNIKDDGPTQVKDNTMLWEGNTCSVMRKTGGNEAIVSDIPCYWSGQSGDAPAPVKYRFDPKNWKWDPDKAPQP